MDKNEVIFEERISKSIYLVRDQKVMMDADLAAMYGVATKVLNQAVKRNLDRFPDDFMFQLSEKEWDDLRSHNVTSSWGGRRIPPYMFTEQGLAMLSSVLKSPQAIKVNISIMRVFVEMRKWATNYSELAKKIEELQTSQGEHHRHIANIYKIIDELVSPKANDRKPIGF